MSGACHEGSEIIGAYQNGMDKPTFMHSCLDDTHNDDLIWIILFFPGKTASYGVIAIDKPTLESSVCCVNFILRGNVTISCIIKINESHSCAFR